MLNSFNRLVCLSIRAAEPLPIAPGVKLEKIAGDFGFTELTPPANTLPYQPMNMHDHKFSRRNFLWTTAPPPMSEEKSIA
jgi:hypothetical protein